MLPAEYQVNDLKSFVRHKKGIEKPGQRKKALTTAQLNAMSSVAVQVGDRQEVIPAPHQKVQPSKPVRTGVKGVKGLQMRKNQGVLLDIDPKLIIQSSASLLQLKLLKPSSSNPPPPLSNSYPPVPYPPISLPNITPPVVHPPLSVLPSGPPPAKKRRLSQDKHLALSTKENQGAADEEEEEEEEDTNHRRRRRRR